LGRHVPNRLRLHLLQGQDEGLLQDVRLQLWTEVSGQRRLLKMSNFWTISSLFSAVETIFAALCMRLDVRGKVLAVGFSDTLQIMTDSAVSIWFNFTTYYTDCTDTGLYFDY
jgi:hypothetical protein